MTVEDERREDRRRRRVGDRRRRRNGRAQRPLGPAPMTYRINHQAEAEYHLLQFTGPPALLESLSHSLRIADAVLRFRIIKVLPGTPRRPLRFRPLRVRPPRPLRRHPRRRRFPQPSRPDRRRRGIEGRTRAVIRGAGCNRAAGWNPAARAGIRAELLRLESAPSRSRNVSDHFPRSEGCRLPRA